MCGVPLSCCDHIPDKQQLKRGSDFSSRSFFSDRALKGMTRGGDDKEGRKAGVRRLHKLCLMPTEFAKKYNIASYIFPGRKM